MKKLIALLSFVLVAIGCVGYNSLENCNTACVINIETKRASIN